MLFIISVMLLIWVIYDLVKGEVWGFYKVYRKGEPLKYWLLVALWFVVAIYCLYYSLCFYGIDRVVSRLYF